MNSINGFVSAEWGTDFSMACLTCGMSLGRDHVLIIGGADGLGLDSIIASFASSVRSTVVSTVVIPSRY